MSGYQVHGIESLRARVILAQKKIARAAFDTALTIYGETGNEQIGTLIGITEDAVFYSPEPNWSPHRSDAFDDLRFIPWEVIREILGGRQ